MGPGEVPRMFAITAPTPRTITTERMRKPPRMKRKMKRPFRDFLGGWDGKGAAPNAGGTGAPPNGGGEGGGGEGRPDGNGLLGAASWAGFCADGPGWAFWKFWLSGVRLMILDFLFVVCPHRCSGRKARMCSRNAAGLIILHYPRPFMMLQDKMRKGSPELVCARGSHRAQLELIGPIRPIRLICPLTPRAAGTHWRRYPRA